MEKDNNNNFLAKWAEGNLSDKEKSDFEKTKDFKYYEAILKGTDLLEVPPYNRDSLFEKIQKNKYKSNKTTTLIPKWAYGIAASIVVLLGFIIFWDKDVNYQTEFGEQLSFVLPDNSEVVLNSKSDINYNKKEWKSNRALNLRGEAYFKVTKGSSFTVNTVQGKVTVLGTRFTVNSDTDIFEVICYEGKVKVINRTNSQVLAKGDAARLVDSSFEKWDINEESPSWIKQRSSFSNAPIYHVINALQKQYNIIIEPGNIDTDLRYSGGFTHTDLEKALITVFEPLNIKYKFVSKNKIVLANK